MTKDLTTPSGPESEVATDPNAQFYIWDTSNPKSIINVVPDQVRESMLRLVNERPDLCDLDEQVLKRYLRSEVGMSLSATDNRIRINFWNEYDRCVGLDKKMTIYGIISRFTSFEFFTKTFLKSNEKVCWMICPLVTYMVNAEEALAFGMDELRDTLSVPHIVGNKIDHKLLNAKITIVKILDARVHGAAVQRTLNYTKTQVDVVGSVSASERERLIENQIKQLEQNENLTQRILETSSKAILPDGIDGF